MSRDGTARGLVYSVTLEKMHDRFGRAPKGETFTASFRNGYPPDEADKLAYRMLQRDRPSENTMAWEITSRV